MTLLYAQLCSLFLQGIRIHGVNLCVYPRRVNSMHLIITQRYSEINLQLSEIDNFRIRTECGQIISPAGSFLSTFNSSNGASWKGHESKSPGFSKHQDKQVAFGAKRFILTGQRFAYQLGVNMSGSCTL